MIKSNLAAKTAVIKSNNKEHIAMQVKITGHHVEVTEALRTHCEEKMAKVKNHFDQAINVNITLEVDNKVQKASANLHASGHDFHAEASETDMYVAIDMMTDKLDRQVLKHKEKLKAH
jgi:putative sigma-54 modulation protein